MLRSFLIGSIVCLAGCGGGGGGGAEEPDAVAAEFAGPIQSADTARGQEVYTANCAGCHDGGAPQLADLGWEPGRMRQQVRRGEGNMPAFDETRVSADDLEALLAFLTTNGAVAGEIPASSGGDAPPEGEAPAEGAEGEEGGADEL